MGRYLGASEASELLVGSTAASQNSDVICLDKKIDHLQGHFSSAQGGAAGKSSAPAGTVHGALG